MSSEETKSYDMAQATSGVQYLMDGYIEYAQAVVTGRALPDLRDGLKPVNRYILYSMHEGKYKRPIKSVKLVGNVTSYHPHGDSSIYQAMVPMTQKNGSLQFPLINGVGNWGGYFTTDGAAAMRYTEAMLHANAEEFFGEMDGIRMIPNFDSTALEPEVLPASFPNVLVNASSGIAVGFKASIPSFNFVDVCNLVKEYVKNGECTTVIYPDFVSGGYYIKDSKELMKLMKVGKAKIKLRGKAVVNGKSIDIVDLPYGKTIEGILAQINNKDFKSIKTAYNAHDRSHGMMIAVECKSKNVVDEVLYSLYKDTDFQYTYSADITVIEDGTPHRMGVWQIIEDWVKWRREVIIADTQCKLDSLIEASKQNRAFAEIIAHPELKEELVLIITRQGADAGVKFIMEHYDNSIFDTELAAWCCRRRISEFHKGGKYTEAYNACLAEINKCKTIIDNVDDEIYSQMDRLINRYGGQMERRTEVTNTDYEFVEDQQEKEIQRDVSTCIFDYRDGFFRKLRVASNSPDVKLQITGTASDTIIAFDNRGRILRIYCEDLPFNTVSDMGLYLPRYFGFEETEDWHITWMGRLDGDTYMLLYKDGNVGFVNTEEWSNNYRNVKVLERGIASSCADILGAVVPLSSVRNYNTAILMVSDEAGRLAWKDLSSIKQKCRTAKTKSINLKRNTPIDSYCILDDDVALVSMLSNQDSYCGTMKDVGVGDFHGDVNILKVF